MLTLVSSQTAESVAPRPSRPDAGGPRFVALRTLPTTQQAAGNVVDLAQARRLRTIEEYDPQGGDAA